MNIPASLLAAWRQGMEVEKVGDAIRVTGGDELPEEEYNARLNALTNHKGEVVTYLKESTYADLVELTRDHGLQWALHDQERTIFMDYPTPDEGQDNFTPEDRAFIFALFLQASPLPHERRHDLMRLQENRYTPKPKKLPSASPQPSSRKTNMLSNVGIKLPL